MESYESTAERQLLLRYATSISKNIFWEVPIGGTRPDLWQGATAKRFIDGVLFLSDVLKNRKHTLHKSGFLALLQNHRAELVEVKKELNRGVIGQAIVARELFKVCYDVSDVTSTILCSKTDAALAWSCTQLNIKVQVIPLI